MFVLDRTGRVLDYAANDAHELYVPAEQVIGRNIRDRLLQDAAESVARAVEQTTNSARPSSVTFSVETAKGTFFYDALVVPFDADSSLMVARDVTSHRQAAQDLEKSNRFFQKLAKTMPGVLFVYDLIEKRILYVNPGAWEGLGYSDDDFRRMGDAFVAMTVHPEDQPRLDALAQEYAKAADGEVFTQLFRMRHKSGEWRWVHRKFTVFTWTPDGRPQQLVGTALDVTDTRMAEEELRKLPGRLLHAQDQERRRIARELHDTTAQNMTALSLNLARLERDGLPPAAAQILADCQTLCGASLREIRTLSYLLHPPMLDEVGLESAVRWFVGGLETRSGLRVTLDAPPAMERLPTALERDLFFVVQEALMNVVRHSGSETADVRLERQATQVILKIRDEGHGMLGARRQPPNDWAFVGVGIPSMRERLRQNGGELEILSNHQGTTIIATVSLQEELTDPPLLGTSPSARVT